MSARPRIVKVGSIEDLPNGKVIIRDWHFDYTGVPGNDPASLVPYGLDELRAIAAK